MKFRALQENLRKLLWERIDAGELTGLHLAEQTGFKQAHISNFLNRKRGLSVEGMDRVLAAQHLSALDLIDPAEVNKRASILPPSENDFESVIVTEPEIAATEARIMSMHVKEIVKFSKRFLKRLKQNMECDCRDWERFVVVRADLQEGMSMYPRMLPGSAILVDRHYNSLAPYRKGEASMYAVRHNGTCTIKYAEVSGGCLVLRPHNQIYPVNIITLESGRRAADHIVGRICHVGMET